MIVKKHMRQSKIKCCYQLSLVVRFCGSASRYYFVLIGSINFGRGMIKLIPLISISINSPADWVYELFFYMTGKCTAKKIVSNRPTFVTWHALFRPVMVWRSIIEFMTIPLSFTKSRSRAIHNINKRGGLEVQSTLV